MKALGYAGLARMSCVASLSLVTLVCLGGISPRAENDGFDAWKSAGQNIHDTHSTQASRVLDPATVPALAVKWVFTSSGNISATPTVEGDAVYVVDWGGNIYRVDRSTGATVWQHSVSEYTGNPASLSRTSPALSGDLVVFGDQAGATVIAVDKASGALRWKTVVDPLPASDITGSPVIANGRVYVGASSQEEVLVVRQPGYVPSFRGKVVALDLATGALQWQFTTVPAGYTGGGVWESTLAVDEERRSLYVGTGNNYTVPPAVATCLGTAVTPRQQLACLDPTDYEDAVLSLDLDNGHLKWVFRSEGSDTFTAVCLQQPAACQIPHTDYDFGAGPVFITLNDGDPRDRGRDHRPHQIVGAGQKSGIYYAFNPDDGKLLWETVVGPGGTFGGIEWGTAADGQRIYVALSNSDHVSFQLEPSGTTWNAGAWTALDAATGTILWQTEATGQDPTAPTFGAQALGAVSAANGVMYASSNAGDMVALDGASGAILWKYPSGGTVLGGPAIVKDTLYWGSGYFNLKRGIPNNKLYAFFVVMKPVP